MKDCYEDFFCYIRKFKLSSILIMTSICSIDVFENWKQTKGIKEEEITCINKNRKYKIYVSNYAMEFNEIEFLCYQKM